MRFAFPKGKRKALTFSYDDGQVFDKRLVEIFNQHGMKGTFHVNSGKLGLHRGNDNYIEKEELLEVYKGHEIACHGVEHRNLPTLTQAQVVREIGEDRKTLERLSGGMVQGMSYAFGNYSEQVIEVAKSLGIKYSRTVNATKNFFPPVDFMEWHPTCHHNDNVLELADQFLDIAGFYELPVMYIWGHSYEFGWHDAWHIIEEIVDKLAGKDDIWYATNMEICDYIQAVRKQEFSADGMTMHNPTALTIWVNTENGLLEIKPGETKYIGE